ncbi:MAG TPA: hypothetical protein VN840_09475 [Streptosporangiaceae bacterium]|nr:hypothetical protein [Streptosporangiaceae bacterium]
MTTHSTRSRVKTAALALCGIAVIATAGCGTAASAASLGHSAAPAGQHAAGTSAVPVVVTCGEATQVRPSSYILPCAGGIPYVSALNWSAWGSSSALASGTYNLDDCIPNCVGGHGHSFPALVVLWDVQPLPGHSGERYFTELTIIATGNRSYTAGGKTYQLPQTLTIPLSQHGGA